MQGDDVGQAPARVRAWQSLLPRQRARSGGAGRAGGPADDAGPGAVDPAVARVGAGLEQTVPVLSLFGAQLGAVVQTTEEATLTFLTDMQAVDGAAAEVVEEVTQLADLSATQAAEIADAARDSTDVIDQLIEFVIRRDTTVSELVEEVRGLSEFVGSIQSISRATTTLALNAKIEASRAGEHGAGFQVVADEVRDLSRQSDAAARDIGNRIEQLAKRLAEGVAESTTARLGDRDGDEALADRLRRISDHQHDLVNRLETVTSRVEEVARQLVGSSATVRGLTTSMMAELQFQDVTRQMVEHVIGGLDDLGQQFRMLAAVVEGQADAGEADLEGTLARLHQTYVMHEQRMVHDRTLGRTETEDAGPGIELF